MEKHCFYHADRSRTLVAGQSIDLDENGHSKFGALYWPSISTEMMENMSEPVLRETVLERIRREVPTFSQGRPSRLSALFCALTVEDAVWRARNVLPPVQYEVPIFEIWTREFVTLDLNWLDFQQPTRERREDNYRRYWWGEITNHNPLYGPRRPPRLEVLVNLPVTVGEIAAHAPIPTPRT